MSQRGGYRPNAGRKKKTDEERVRDLSVKAIIDTYGGEQEGFKALLATQEPVLVKFVFEHAYGKPKDKIEASGGFELVWHETKTYEAKHKTDKGD